MGNKTSDFEKQILDKIYKRELFYCDIMELAREGFITDLQMVRRLLKVCIERKNNDTNLIYADVKDSDSASILCDVLKQYLKDDELNEIKKALEVKIYG